MATLYAKTAGGNWSAAGTWSNVNASGGDSSGPPTAADDVIFELLSGNVTIDAAAVCRSLNTTSGTGSYGGTITHNASIGLTIGDATVGAGNVALDLSAGTYTKGSSTTSTIAFASTSTTQQAVTWNATAPGNVTFSGTGGVWQFTNGYTNTAASLTIGRGTTDINGQTLSISHFVGGSTGASQVFTMGAASLTLNAASTTVWTTGTGITLTANTATITCVGATPTFAGGGVTTYNTVVFNTGGGTITITGANTFANLTVTGTASKTNSLSLGAAQTISGVFTINGNSAVNRVWVRSSVWGTNRTITAATVTVTNIDLSDITGAGAGSWNISAVTGGAADVGGNSGITFTTPVTRYWIGGTGNWSATAEWAATSGGASGATVPLAHDTVEFDANSFSTTGLTVTRDMRFLGTNITWAAGADNPTCSGTNGLSNYILGNETLSSGMTWNYSGGAIQYIGRSSHTITSNGVSHASSSTGSGAGNIIIDALTGTYTLADAFTISGAANGSAVSITRTTGTFSTGGFNVTCHTTSGASGTTTVLTGSGTWTLTGTGTVWNEAGTVTPGTGIILINDSSTSAKTFTGGGKTYPTLQWTRGNTGTLTVGGANTFVGLTVDGSGTGAILITGSNTLGVHSSDASGAAMTYTLTAGTTQTVSAWTRTAGTNVITLQSATAATHTWSKSGGGVVSLDYMSISRSTASQANTFYAGANSTDGGSNSQWIFTVPPSAGRFLALLGVG